MQGIYKIINKANGKYYVGSSVDVEKRWLYEHLPALRKGAHSLVHLQNAWNKYGAKMFECRIIEEVRDREALLSVEQRHLDEGFELGILYNKARMTGGGAVRGTGWHPTKETRAKMRRGQLGKKASKETRAKMSRAKRGEKAPCYGKTGEAHPYYGHRHTKAWKQGASERNSGKGNPMYGERRSEEFRTKVAKPYPAFYNDRTGEYIPAGHDLTRLCRGRDLNFHALWNLKHSKTKCSHEGWRLA